MTTMDIHRIVTARMKELELTQYRVAEDMAAKGYCHRETMRRWIRGTTASLDTTTLGHLLTMLKLTIITKG